MLCCTISLRFEPDDLMVNWEQIRAYRSAAVLSNGAYGANNPVDDADEVDDAGADDDGVSVEAFRFFVFVLFLWLTKESCEDLKHCSKYCSKATIEPILSERGSR